MSSILESQIQAAEQEWLVGWKRGPQRIRWSTIPLQVNDPAPDFDLSDSTGKVIKLSSMWSDTPALVLFWRGNPRKSSSTHRKNSWI